MTRARHLAILVLTAAVLGAVSLAGCGGSSLPDGVVARVGDQDISQAELDQIVNQQAQAAEQQGQAFSEPGSEEYATVQRLAVEGLVFTRIVLLEAEKCGTPCVATTAEVAADRNRIIKENFGGDSEKFAEYLTEEGLTAADADRIIRAGIEEPRLTARVTKGITVTPAQALAYCVAHPDEFKEPTTREASHILVKTEAEAEAIRAQATTANFADLARQYSTDPGSKDQGGDLGTIQTGALVPEFEKVALALDDGEISDPVETQFGWHIITVRVSQARDIPCDEAEAQIISSQTQVKRNEAIQKWRTGLVTAWAPKTVYADPSLEPVSGATG